MVFGPFANNAPSFCVKSYDDCPHEMSATPPLQIDQLTCCYGATPVIDHLSFTLEAGEILGIAGAEGAGVSTLLKAVLLLVAPKSGRVLIFAKPHELASSRSQLAYLPEEINVPGHLTGYDVVNMTRTVHGEVKAKSSIDDLARRLDLPEQRLIHPTRDCTKADSQKLGLIALLSMEKPILLLDQPMSHIGPEAKAGLTDCLRAYVAKGGAVLLGSHRQDDHQGVSDRLITLEKGKMVTMATSGKKGDLAPISPRRQDDIISPTG